jgi:hypothetical protein
MELTKRQKVFLVIMIIVLAALIVDRAYLGRSNPSKAQAEISDSSNITSGEGVPATEVVPDLASQSPTMKLTRGIESLWSEKNPDLSQSRDAFCLPEPWLAEISPDNLRRTFQGAETSFARNHQLKVIVVQGQTRCVMVDDHFLVIGQELEGFKLVAVDENSATFESGAKRVVLRLENDR